MHFLLLFIIAFVILFILYFSKSESEYQDKHKKYERLEREKLGK